jgi:hypothetical protein
MPDQAVSFRPHLRHLYVETLGPHRFRDALGDPAEQGVQHHDRRDDYRVERLANRHGHSAGARQKERHRISELASENLKRASRRPLREGIRTFRR